MSKIIVTPKNEKHLNKLLDDKIDAVLLSIENLSINSEYYISLNKLREILPKIKEKNKEVFISVNKIMHNYDIEELKICMQTLKELNVDKILFYDLSILSIADKLNITNKLVIYNEHSNASISSHKFYQSYGVDESLITSDITLEEINEIKKQTGIKLIVPVYGHIPIMYSRRYLLTNYFNHIKKQMTSPYYYFKQNEDKYIIKEETYGTAIYSGKIINLDEEYQKYQNTFDYIILYSNFIDASIYDNTIKHYLNINELDKFNNSYKGFAYTKTTYKVKKDE